MFFIIQQASINLYLSIAIKFFIRPNNFTCLIGLGLFYPTVFVIKFPLTILFAICIISFFNRQPILVVKFPITILQTFIIIRPFFLNSAIFVIVFPLSHFFTTANFPN